MYSLQNVIKMYERHGQKVTALEETNLEIPDNDFVAIIGPSGSGKTTMLSLLGGMLAPSSGRVVLDGVSLYALSVKERTKVRSSKIGFVFQSFNLIPWLSAQENVQIPLVLSGCDSRQQQERAAAMLEKVGLADRMNHKPNEMSQGQQQRVALARTLANDPQIILADEPTGNLDPETREQVMEYLSEFHQDGRTIVMVTHDEAAAKFATRTIRLVAGVATDLNAESHSEAA